MDATSESYLVFETKAAKGTRDFQEAHSHLVLQAVALESADLQDTIKEGFQVRKTHPVPLNCGGLWIDSPFHQEL